MKKYFLKINFLYLCTPIHVVYFSLNFKGDEGGEYIRYPLRGVRGFWRQLHVYILLVSKNWKSFLKVFHKNFSQLIAIGFLNRAFMHLLTTQRCSE